MDFIENIFVDSAINDFDTVLYSLKKNIPVFNIYLVCVEEKTRNYAVMMSSVQFFKKINAAENYKVIGIASGKYGANRLFSQIIEYWLTNNNSIFDFKANIIKE